MKERKKVTSKQTKKQTKKQRNKETKKDERKKERKKEKKPQLKCENVFVIRLQVFWKTEKGYNLKPFHQIKNRFRILPGNT